MKTLSVLKKDLEFNKGLGALLEALKNIAVTQFKILEHRMKTYEKLLLSIESFIDLIDVNTVVHPFITPQNQSQAVVAVTSDSGLLGGLNMQVINAAIRELEKIPGRLIVIGERGKMYMRDTKIPFVAFPGIQDDQRHPQAMQLRDYLMARAFEGQFGYLKIVFPRPVSFTVQKVEVIAVLPFNPAMLTKPAAGQKEYIAKLDNSDIIVESDIGDILEYLLYLWTGQKLYECFGLARLAEFAARFIHLEDSGQKLKEIDNKTRLEYFRVRHEIIDRNMRELFAARLLFTGKSG